MNDIAETIDYKGYKVEVMWDPEAEDPLCPMYADADEAYGLMVCFHSRYTLGHYNHPDNEWSKHLDRDGFNEYLQENKRDIISVPLYLYDHSGITMNTTGFSCRWDSGMVGVYFITKEEIRKQYCRKRVTKKLANKVRETLQAIVETYDQYLTGEVFGYRVIDPQGNETDSCWGFFGNDHKYSNLMESATAAIDADIDHKLKTEGLQTQLELAVA